MTVCNTNSCLQKQNQTKQRKIFAIYQI